MSSEIWVIIMTKVILPQSGVAFNLEKGQRLKVIDPCGQQVSDLVLFNRHQPGEKLSAGKTFDFEESLLITKGNRLWSNFSRVLATIIEDTNGRNDFLLAPCSPETFEIMYGVSDYHPSCFENLVKSLATHGIGPEEIPTAFNIFMNVQFALDGSIAVRPPTSAAGDYLCIRAEQDLIVGMTACSAEDSNNGSFKPIHYQIG